MKRALCLLVLVLGSVVYCAAWLGVAVLVTWIQGDCAAGSTQSELVQCVTQQRWIVWAVIAFAAALWVLIVIGAAKERWPKN